MDVLEMAMSWLKAGIPPIPVFSRTKKAMVKWEKYQTKLPTESDVCTWFNHGDRNLAVICGWQNLAILDIESFDVYSMLKDLAPWPRTLEIKTGRGAHVYFFTQEPEPKAKFSWQAEIRSEKSQYCLTAPSLHPSGARYEIMVNAPIATVASIRSLLPAELLENDQENRKTGKQNPTGGKVECFPSTPPIPCSPPVDSSPWQIVNQGEPPLSEKIKAAYRIEQFFKDATSTDRTGRWLVAKCPFHDDGNPSFWIDTYSQKCGCYAGCTAKSLDVIGLYAKLNGMTQAESIKILGKNCH